MFFVSVARGGKRSNDFVYDSFEWLTDWLTKWMNEWVNDCDGVTNWQSELFKFSGIGGRSVGQGLLLWREMFTRFQVVNWFDFGHFGTFVCLQNFCSRQVAKISIGPICMCIYQSTVSPFPHFPAFSLHVWAWLMVGVAGEGGPFQPIIHAQLSSVWTADVCNASWISVPLFTSISLRLLLADNLFCQLLFLPDASIFPSQDSGSASNSDTLTFDMSVEVLSTGAAKKRNSCQLSKNRTHPSAPAPNNEWCGCCGQSSGLTTDDRWAI